MPTVYKSKFDETFRKKHEDNLFSIYKKLFGFYRTEDKEARNEIASEARIIARELSKETQKIFNALLKDELITNVDSNNNVNNKTIDEEILQYLKG